MWINIDCDDCARLLDADCVIERASHPDANVQDRRHDFSCESNLLVAREPALINYASGRSYLRAQRLRQRFDRDQVLRATDSGTDTDDSLGFIQLGDFKRHLFTNIN